MESKEKDWKAQLLVCQQERNDREKKGWKGQDWQSVSKKEVIRKEKDWLSYLLICQQERSDRDKKDWQLELLVCQ